MLSKLCDDKQFWFEDVHSIVTPIMIFFDSYHSKSIALGLICSKANEIPSNVLQAEEFAELFDGFSIGSNDLTQLTLGIDRDSSLVADLFSEQTKSAKKMIAMLIDRAKKSGTKIGLCGQVPE